MVYSMTAFASQAGQGEWSHVLWEIRSVNHRYLEISIRLPEELRGLETAARERISHYIQRGKVDCVLRYNTLAKVAGRLSINMELANQVVRACREIDTLLTHSAPFSSLEILRWPGVVEFEWPNIDKISAPLLAILDAALVALVEARKREGEALRALIEDRCEQARVQIRQLRNCLPEILSALKDRLLNRALEVAIGLDQARLEQEMLLLAQKLDVAEELERLDTHLAEVKRVLEQPGSVGRRLDFLMQEMNREANTIAAKSVHIESTRASIELKVLIEQMREQVQNIE